MAKQKKFLTCDGNQAAAHISYMFSEVAAIYPITPSSTMAEFVDEWAAAGRKNIFGETVLVQEMQSEGGAAGAVHGALQAGALTTTYTASQGLLLMIPNMYKIAGELLPCVFHVSARTIASHSLSIFGDHQDVMACRQTGFAMLAEGSVQEVMDLAAVAHLSTIKSRVPFVNFFDGFRISHEVQKIEALENEDLAHLIDRKALAEFRARALSPEHPVARGMAENPDTFFQHKEAVNKYYRAVPRIVERYMKEVSVITGRNYGLFDYYGAKDADRIIIAMGAVTEAIREAIDYLTAKGERVGLVAVHLYRPFSAKHLGEAIPETVKRIAVLDRTKEPGANGEPLYMDVVEAFASCKDIPANRRPLIIGGRFGLSSKDTTPTQILSVYKNLAMPKPKNNFTIGIVDNLSFTSLPQKEEIALGGEDVFEAKFYGLGADGTVGANKNSIKIIGDNTDKYCQAYFSYDSKKSGGFTISHLRFGRKAIRRPYLITQADFLACHKFSYMETLDMLAYAKQGGVFLLNSPFSADKVWENVPVEAQQRIIDKKLKFYVIDAAEIARKTGMGKRINTVMQAAYFKISGVLPEAQAVEEMKHFIQKSYGKKGADVVQKNYATVDASLGAVVQVNYPGKTSGNLHMKKPFATAKDNWIREVLGKVSVQEGDKLKVSQIPEDGTFPTATTQYEKRAVAEQVPAWDPNLCIQCGNCAVVCSHACIRMKNLTDGEAGKAPEGFLTAAIKPKAVDGKKVTLQISCEDCMECGVCINACPVKALSWRNYADDPAYHARQSAAWDYFQALPETPAAELNLSTAKGLAFKRPLFEFSGACGGCGETPYVKILSQLFGDRAVIANATGCSSIYGGNLPTTPYAKRADGRGPVWSNSLFEDAAEFGLGMRLTSDKLAEHAREVAAQAKAEGVQAALLDKILANAQADDAAIEEQRKNVDQLKAALKNDGKPLAKNLLSLADYFIKRSVWILGGDGWGYDIGYGGLDHVLASGRNVNILCMDTEVYSNTGGQMSKATPVGAIAKFAAAGKDITKKDLGAMAMSYGYVYVARISMGANMAQTIKAFREAESYPGSSLIIAYSHCINHGIDMSRGLEQQKAAVTSGIWPLYRYDPRLKDQGKNPFQLDSKEATTALEDFMYKEVRFKSLKAASPDRADALLAKAKAQVERTWKEYKYLADRPF
jgi:pyruvate-ferredoxin/flavodoxin oxidoreductase